MRCAAVKVFGVVLGIVVFLPGCALTTAKCDLGYAPEKDKKSPLSTIAPLKVTLQVADHRDAGEKDRVGDKKNNLGQVTAKIVSVKPVVGVLQEALAKERRDQIGSGDRSQRIRTYNWPQNRITDHRAGVTLHKLQEILEGDLDQLVEPLLEWDKQEKLKRI